jgi:hypothetical protein
LHSVYGSEESRLLYSERGSSRIIDQRNTTTAETLLSSILSLTGTKTPKPLILARLW